MTTKTAKPTQTLLPGVSMPMGSFKGLTVILDEERKFREDEGEEGVTIVSLQVGSSHSVRLSGDFEFENAPTGGSFRVSCRNYSPTDISPSEGCSQLDLLIRLVGSKYFEKGGVIPLDKTSLIIRDSQIEEAILQIEFVEITQTGITYRLID